MLTFYDFPAEHWVLLRTTNPVESTFATVRLHTNKTRGCLSRDTTLTMGFKLCLSAEKRRRRLNGAEHMTAVLGGIEFRDGVRVEENAAEPWHTQHVHIARVVRAPENCGRRFRKPTVNRRRFIQTSMSSMSGAFPLRSTNPSANCPAKPTTLNGSTTRSGSVFRVWYAVRCHSPRNWPITSAPSSISYATTT